MKTSGLENLRPEERRFVEFECLGAKINFDKFGYLLPIVIIGNLKKADIQVIGLSFENQAEKIAMTEMLKNMIVEKDIDVVMTILESYYLSNEDAEEYMKHPEKWQRIKDHPKAKDAVMFSYENRYGTMTARADILRAADGNKKIEEARFQPSKSEGIFSEFMKIKMVKEIKNEA